MNKMPITKTPDLQPQSSITKLELEQNEIRSQPTQISRRTTAAMPKTQAAPTTPKKIDPPANSDGLAEREIDQE